MHIKALTHIMSVITTTNMNTTSIFDSVIPESIKTIDQYLSENVDVFGGQTDQLDELIEELDPSYLSTKPSELIFEELTSSEQYSADRMVGSGRDFYMDSFISKHPTAQRAFANSYESGEKKGRIRVPIEFAPQGHEPNPTVVSHLRNNGYSTDSNSYAKGLASKEILVGNPERGIPFQKRVVQKRIGAVLKETGAHPDTVRSYENDPIRKSASENQYDMIITHRAHDIYGGSTGRGWTSCANMRRGEKGYGGPASKKMKDEINNHTHMVYLVPRGGDVDKQAIGRVSFKHHTSLSSNHQTIFPENAVYGDAPHGFREAAAAKMEELFPHSKREVYVKNSNVYNDNGKMFHFPDNEAEPATVDAAWKHLKGLGKSLDMKDHHFGKLKALVVPGQKYASTELNRLSKTLQGANDVISQGNFHHSVDAINDVSYEIPQSQHHAATGIGSPEAQHNHTMMLINKAASQFDPKNPDHLKLASNIGGRPFGNHIQGELRGAIKRHALSGSCVTADDVCDKIRIHDAFGEYKTTKINIDEKHKLGAYPLKKVAETLASRNELTSDNFQRAYHSLSSMHRGGGNLYDHVVKLENQNVPGASALVNSVASGLSDRLKEGIRGEYSVAQAFHYTKPENRARLADAMGISDHKAFLRPHLKAIKAFDKEIEERQKQRELEQQANPE